jgi:Phosphotyrosine interaction domain (PTB/PID)
MKNSKTASDECGYRVKYLGSAAVQVTHDVIEVIQEPLHQLYGQQDTNKTKGTDCWLLVSSAGLQLESPENQEIIQSLPKAILRHSIVVRYVADSGRFVPLDGPISNQPVADHPPLLVAISNPSVGKMECHAFACQQIEDAQNVARLVQKRGKVEKSGSGCLACCAITTCCLEITNCCLAIVNCCVGCLSICSN